MDLVEQNFFDIIKSSNRITSIIKTIELISSENLMLTGGSLRNVIWNFMHYYGETYELEDCDIIFYNSSDISKIHEETIRSKLEYLNPDINWSVKNQARMHIRNGHNPYSGIYEALTAFPETCSAVAIDKNWNFISPYGLDDLLDLNVTPSEFCIDNEIKVFLRRVNHKNWLDKWPELKLQKNNECFSNKEEMIICT